METSKKILLVNWRDPRHPAAGGAENYLFEIFKRLADRGEEIFWLASSFAGALPEEELAGIKIIRIKGANFLFPWNFFRFYKKFLQKENFSLVVEGLSKLPLLTPFYVKSPLLVIFFQFHGGIFFKELFFPLALLCYSFEALVALIYRKQKMVVISESTRVELTRWGFSRFDTRVISPGLDLKQYTYDLSLKTAWPSAVYLGRLKKYKGLADLLKAWKMVLETFPAARLNIIGRGGDLGRLKKIARLLGINQTVSFSGFLSDEEKNKILSRFWVMVYPSMKEGFGIALIEANASGVPVVGYRVSGIKDVVKEGKTGYLVDYRDISGLVRSIKNIFQDGLKRETMSRQARELSKCYNWEQSATKFQEIVKELVASG